MTNYKNRAAPSIFILETEMPADVIKEVNICLDKKLTNKQADSNADRLVGQGQTITQLQLNALNEKGLKGFYAITLKFGVEYIKQYFEHTNQKIKYGKKLELDSLWSVHSFEGDYNPLHDHVTKTTMGISFTGWTKMPKQIGENGDDMYNASGASDGFINFTWGSSSVIDAEKLKPTSNMLIKPEMGKLLFFPSWVQHIVYPFRGEGERRTIAGNINCWDIKQDKATRNR